MAKTVSLGEASALLDNALSKPAKRASAKKTTKRKTTKRKSARRPAKKTTKRRTKRAAPKRKTTKRKTTKRTTTKRTKTKRRASRRKPPVRHVGGGKRHRQGKLLTAAEKKALGLGKGTFDEGDAKFLRDYMSHKKKYGQHPTIGEKARYHETGAFHEAKPKKRTNYAKLKPSEWPK